MEFVHLHVHSNYSLLDGLASVKELVAKAKELGMPALAITDHGYMYGVVDFYNECKSAGIKPIIGCEVYTAARTIYDKTPEDRHSGHLVLLAKNETGYHNLIELCSIAATKGKYYRPRVDMDLLKKYHEGLICMSACINGDIPHKLIEGDYAGAKALAAEYQSIFGEDFYIELQWHGIKEEAISGRGLRQIASELGIAVVATNDVHYVNKEDAEAQHFLMAMAAKKQIDDPECFGYGTPPEMYFKTQEEMSAIFGKSIPESLTNTLVIANKCNLEIEQGNYHLPKFPTPAGFSSNVEYFESICRKGLVERYGELASERSTQLEYEISTIEQMGFVDYFLIVSDFIRWAKDNGISVGPGRGSAAGSMVSYVMRITELDPVRYGLLFERFLNPERITMPDIDVDIEVPEGREAVIAYVTEKYGADHVAKIITFGSLAAKSAIRDVGKACGYDLKFVNSITSLIPTGPDVTIRSVLDSNEKLKKLYKTDDKARRVIDIALKVEGSKRQPGIHAAGLVVCPERITDHVPVTLGKKKGGAGNADKAEEICTQYYMGAVEAVGMLKVDFLGLRNLTIMKDAVAQIKEQTGKDIDLNNIPLDDRKVYEMLSNGDSSGCFQLESEGMRKVLMELKPSNIEDIIACVALYRPGPMDSIPTFIENKHNPSKVVFKHPLLEPILKDTYGCIVYQEQVMQIVRDLAGYSYGRSDLVRRVMSKKKAAAMAAEKDIFMNGQKDEKTGEVIVPGALANGIPEDVATELWEDMSAFAAYAFNRAHAAAYGIIAYQTAWLKVNYPLQYRAAMLTNASDNPKKLLKLFADCDAHGVQILPPNINKSHVDFFVEGDSIRFGLNALKGVGRAVLEEVQMERSYGDYTSLQSLIERNQMASKKDVIEVFIKSGALDGIGANRAQMMAAYPDMLKKASKIRKKVAKDQLTLEEMFFSEAQESDIRGISLGDVIMPAIEEMDKKSILEGELASTGMYISGHPMTEYAKKLEGRTTHMLYQLEISDADSEDDAEMGTLESDVPPIPDGTQVRVAGIIQSMREHVTAKSKQAMCFANLEDQTGSVEITIFPRAYEAVAGRLAVGSPVLIFGKTESSEYGGKLSRKIIVDSIEFLDAEPSKIVE